MRFTLTLLFSLTVFALPKRVEVVFLAPEKEAVTTEVLEEFKTKNFRKLAQADVKCVPMGDGCFHPQLGYMEGDSAKGIVDQESGKQKEVKIKTINSMDTDMIDCKKGNYFDIFCGKAKKEKHGPVDYEIWIDTSSSLRRVDWSKEQSHCSRRTFIEKLRRSCDLEIQTFDTSIKQMGSLSNLCLTYGLNDQKRLIKWIDDSSAKHLIIVTDIDESSIELRNYLESIGAVIHGADYGDFTGKKLIEYADTFAKSCQKKKK